MRAAEWEEKLKDPLPHVEERLAANRKKIEERIRMEQSKTKRYAYKSAAVVLVMALSVVAFIVNPDVLSSGFNWLTGVSNHQTTAAVSIDDMQERPLKVFVYMNEHNFSDKYGRLTMLKNPNVSFDIVTYKLDQQNPVKAYGELKQQIESEKPDLIHLPSGSGDLYGKLVKDGLLVQLDPLIKKHKFDLDGLHPYVTESIRSKSGGKLYALSPTMISKALYYNKDLFDRHQLPYPTNKMTWDELTKLAGRFPAKEQGIYGLQMSGEKDPFQAVEILAAGRGLSPVSSDGDKVDLQSREWTELWSSVVEMYKNKTLYNRPGMETGKSYTLSDLALMNGFLTGKTAMEIASNTELGEILSMKSNGLTPFSWGVVTVPVEPDVSETDGIYSLDDLLAIPSDSNNVENAWEVLQYIHSEEMAQILPKARGYNIFARSNYPLLARQTAMKEVEGVDLKPFYELKAAIAKEGRERIPISISGEWSSYGNEELRSVLEDGKNAADALISLEGKLQQKYAGASNQAAKE